MKEHTVHTLKRYRNDISRLEKKDKTQEMQHFTNMKNT